MSFQFVPRACDCLAATAQQLVAQGGVALDIGLEELALFGTSLDDATIVTSNAHAVLEGRGGYAAFQPVGQRLRLNPHRPAMRMADARDMSVMMSPANHAGPAALCVIAADGRIQHRIQVAGTDWDRVGTLPYLGSYMAPVTRTHPVDAPNIIRMDEIRARRAKWAHATVATAMDDVLADAGRSRLRCLPHIGRGARRVRADLLHSFMDFLCARNVDAAISIFAEAMVQTLFGRCMRTSAIDDFAVCETSSGRFFINRRGVSQAWICRHGPMAHLELYNGAGMCVAFIHAPICGDWASFLEAYPDF